ncbi:MAG: hypothetical protein LBM65_05305 [Oscillospiraceae bacterium]|jgi:predicted NBD/HSP70 family sugar kinase|nr:hypothetical protein [Oscillospiraceae bacterium]
MNDKIADVIRRLDAADRQDIAKFTGISLPTISSYITQENKDGGKVELNSNNSVSLRSDFCYYIGISIGTKITRLCVIDFNFQVHKNEDLLSIFKEYQREADFKSVDTESLLWYLPTPKTLEGFLFVFSLAIGIILNQFNLKIGGIGFSFPGAVDYANNVVVKCNCHPCLEGIRTTSILMPDIMETITQRDITIAFESNAKASIVAEKEFIETTDKRRYKNAIKHENIACFSFGSSVSASYILQNRLHRGVENLSGRISYMIVPEQIFDILEIKEKEQELEIKEKEKEHELELKEKANKNRVTYSTNNDLYIKWRKESNEKSNCKYEDCFKSRITLLYLFSKKRASAFNVQIGNCGDVYDVIDKIEEKIKNKEPKLSPENIIDLKELKYWLLRRISRMFAWIASVHINMLSLDTIIFSGKAANYFNDFFPFYLSDLKCLSYDNMDANASMITSSKKETAPTIGAAICAYFGSNSYDTIEW